MEQNTVKGVVFESAEAVIAYLRDNVKGMEEAYLPDFVSQVGTRGSRHAGSRAFICNS